MTSVNVSGLWQNVFLTICFLASVASYKVRVNSEAAQIETRCRTQTNVPQSDIDNYQNMELPQTREGKCYGACVLKAVNMMTSRGKINEKKVEEIAASQTQDENDLRRVDSKIQACSRRANLVRDECETAYQFMSCSRKSRSKSSRQLSFTLPEISFTLPPVTLVLLQLAP